MISNITVLTAGSKNTMQTEDRKATASTIPTRSFSAKARAPTASISSPRRASIATMTVFRLHLSITVPLKGMTIICINKEMEDMMPMRELDPVFS